MLPVGFGETHVLFFRPAVCRYLRRQMDIKHPKDKVWNTAGIQPTTTNNSIFSDRDLPSQPPLPHTHTQRMVTWSSLGAGREVTWRLHPHTPQRNSFPPSELETSSVLWTSYSRISAQAATPVGCARGDGQSLSNRRNFVHVLHPFYVSPVDAEN